MAICACLAQPKDFHLFVGIVQANMWLGTLLLDRSDDIYRMKGLLSVQGMDERFVFQVSETLMTNDFSISIFIIFVEQLGLRFELWFS